MSDPAPTPRRRFQFSLRTLLLFMAALSLLWGLTASWGVRDVKAHVNSWMDANVASESENLGFDAVRKNKPANIPWHYVGNASSPFPLIVGVDWAVRHGSLFGTGRRVYFLWILGVKIHLYDTTYWNS